MVLKKITAIIPARKLEDVERGLQRIGVPGITVTVCKGYGEYERFAKFDWSLPRARIEIYCASERAGAIKEAVLEAAHTGEMGDGIVALEPVETLWRVRTKAEVVEREI